MSTQPFTFAEFYPRYLREHSRRGTRVLHFVGTTLFIVCLAMLLRTGNWNWLAAGVVAAYGFAWVGHFFVEHNRPATFQHPWYSLLGDFRMYFDLWRGREKFGDK
ncbi:DUF962 domain-containing protein [Hymenobacter agri]